MPRLLLVAHDLRKNAVLLIANRCMVGSAQSGFRRRGNGVVLFSLFIVWEIKWKTGIRR